MPRKYVHPLIRMIDRSKKEKKVSNDDLAKVLCLNERTIYRKRKKPETFTLAEIDIMSEFFGWNKHYVLKITGDLL